MTSRMHVLAVTAVAAVVLAGPVHLYGQHATEPAGQAAHHPEAGAATTTPPAAHAMMEAKTSSAALDALVTKMNAAKGAAKTDAIAELLTALVKDRQECETMMANKPKMSPQHGDTDDATPSHPASK